MADLSLEGFQEFEKRLGFAGYRTWHLNDCIESDCDHPGKVFEWSGDKKVLKINRTLEHVWLYYNTKNCEVKVAFWDIGTSSFYVYLMTKECQFRDLSSAWEDCFKIIKPYNGYTHLQHMIAFCQRNLPATNIFHDKKW